MELLPTHVWPSLDTAVESDTRIIAPGFPDALGNEPTVVVPTIISPVPLIVNLPQMEFTALPPKPLTQVAVGTQPGVMEPEMVPVKVIVCPIVGVVVHVAAVALLAFGMELVAAVVAFVPPLAMATVPVTLPAVPVVFNASVFVNVGVPEKFGLPLIVVAASVPTVAVPENVGLVEETAESTVFPFPSNLARFVVVTGTFVDICTHVPVPCTPVIGTPAVILKKFGLLPHVLDVVRIGRLFIPDGDEPSPRKYAPNVASEKLCPLPAASTSE